MKQKIIKEKRNDIYNFLQENGFDLIKYRSGLKKLLVEYVKEPLEEIQRLELEMTKGNNAIKKLSDRLNGKES